MPDVRPPRPSSTRAATKGLLQALPVRVAWTLLALLVTLGIGAWPLAAPAPTSLGHVVLPLQGADDGDASPAPAPSEDTGMGAPQPPLLHAGSGPLQAATGPTVDPAPPVPIAQTARRGGDRAMAALARTPRRRTRAQRFFGRRNLDGG